MLKAPSTTTTPTASQLLQAFLTSFTLALTAFSFLFIFVLLLIRATAMFAGAWLALINAGCNAAIDLVSSYDGIRDYAAFLAR